MEEAVEEFTMEKHIVDHQVDKAASGYKARGNTPRIAGNFSD
jgi:hypothetical protein